MKKLLFALSAAFVFVAVAEETANNASPEEDAKRQAMIARRREKIEVPGSQRGRFLFANAAAKQVATSNIADTVALIVRNLDIKFDVCETEAATPAVAAKKLREKGASAGVFVVYEKDLPILLSAPEESWVILNARAVLTSDDDPDVVAKRLKGELFRAFTIAAGAHRSQFGGNIMSVGEVKDIDKLPEIFFPYDVYQRILENFEHIGISPRQYVRYSVALAEGWAPAPTNDVQREIVRIYQERNAAEKSGATKK